MKDGSGNKFHGPTIGSSSHDDIENKHVIPKKQTRYFPLKHMPHAPPLNLNYSNDN